MNNKKNVKRFVFSNISLNKTWLDREILKSSKQYKEGSVVYLLRLLNFFFQDNSLQWIIFFLLKIIITVLGTLMHVSFIYDFCGTISSIQDKCGSSDWWMIYKVMWRDKKFLYAFSLFVILSILKKILEYVRNFIIKNNVRIAVLKKMLYVVFRKPYSFFVHNSLGKILERLDEIPDNTYEFVFCILERVLEVIVAVGAIIFLEPSFRQSKILLFSIFVWMIIHAYIGLYKYETLSYFMYKTSQSYSKTMGTLSDSLRNIFITKIFNKEDDEWNKKILPELEIERRYNSLSYNNILSKKCWYSLNFYVFFFLIFIPLVIRNIKNKSDYIRVLVMGMFEIYSHLWEFIQDFFESLDELYKLLEIINFFSPNKYDFIEGYSKLLHKQIKEETVKHVLNLNETAPEIKFENINLSINNKIILNNINFHIKAGEKIGIVGSSGSGKTTIMNIILGLIKPTTGNILINNHNIKNINKIEWLKSLTLVPQIPFLFERSFKENMLFGVNNGIEKDNFSHFSHKMIKQTKCNFIYQQPKKLDFNIGRGGEKISGGQRQRLSILRALLRTDAKLLLLDEATSAMDNVTENIVIKTINEYSKNKTMIIIVHKLSTIMKMDRILVMKKGEIVEFDSFDNLLKKKGEFFNLWNSVDSTHVTM